MKAKTIKTLRDCTPDDLNANKGTPRGAQLLESSLQTYGAGRSILVDRQGKIIAGNKTFEQAGAIGLDRVQVVQTKGDELVVVQRTDLDMDSDPRARELGIADNRVQQIDLEWNAEILAQLKDEGVELSGMFTEKELAAILPQGESKDADISIDKAAELQQKWEVATGEVVQIGRHRLMCGDSTNKADVGALCVGNRPLLMVTDPPYGVDYDANWRNEADRANGKPYGARAIGKVTNDNRADWSAAYALSPADVAYVWHPAGATQRVFFDSIMAAGFEVRMQIIWAKNQFPIGRGHYHVKHEPCYYAVRKGATAKWVGDRSQTTLWEIDKPHKSETGHSTQKPLECMARPIRNHEGDVYDPFVGSGTTLVAAENLNRTCYAMEISPEYCAMVLERMTTAFPHLKIEREAITRAA